jgi:hypothetical protein
VAITLEGSGSQVATVGTEHTLDTISATGVFLLEVDCSVLQAQDVVELRIKGPTLSGGTTRVHFFAAYYGVQMADDAMKVSVPFPIATGDDAHVVTLKQTFGTSRTFPWAIRNLQG